MARPYKRLSVTPDMRKKWMARQDQYGESNSQIAAKDGYDVRTVRHQIELARQEIEQRETRLMVLRNAAEGHYQDLCKFLERIDLSISRFESTDHITHERIYSALRQHLPRSPLWSYLDKWNRLQNDLRDTKNNLETETSEMISHDIGLDKAFAGLMIFILY